MEVCASLSPQLPCPSTTPTIGAASSSNSSDCRHQQQQQQQQQQRQCCSLAISAVPRPRDSRSLITSRWRMSRLLSSVELMTTTTTVGVGSCWGAGAGGRRIGDFGSRRSPERPRRRVCSQLVESAKDVREELSSSQANKEASSKCVLVVGATGGVGQLVVASLMEKGHPVRAILRNPEKAKALFGDQEPQQFQVHVADTRQQELLAPSLFEGVTHVICCTGTTAFPSKRWDGDNGPEKTDWHGVRNLVAALPSTIQQFVLVSSVGITRVNQLPYKIHQNGHFAIWDCLILGHGDEVRLNSILNLFGVLKYKKMAEDFLCNSGIPYTIIRPGRLTDGPYTSYDLNTLIKATSGTRRDVIIGQGDTLMGETSRIDVAEACVQALDLLCTIGQTYEINSIEGVGPGKDKSKWETLFKGAHNISASK